MSDVKLSYDKTDRSIIISVNGVQLDGVAAANVAVNKAGSACTVVFEAGAVDVDGLVDQLMLNEEPPANVFGGN